MVRHRHIQVQVILVQVCHVWSSFCATVQHPWMRVFFCSQSNFLAFSRISNEGMRELFSCTLAPVFKKTPLVLDKLARSYFLGFDVFLAISSQEKLDGFPSLYFVVRSQLRTVTIRFLVQKWHQVRFTILWSPGGRLRCLVFQYEHFFF